MTVEEIKEKLRKKAVGFITGGIRPTYELKESWIGRVCWQLPGETQPLNSQGDKMIPIATIFLDGLEYIPNALKNIKMINIFMDNNIWGESRLEDYNKWFKINTYETLDNLVACDYRSDKINAFPLLPNVVYNEFPEWEDVDWELTKIICEMEKKDGTNYYDDIFEGNYQTHKIGGYPSTIQSGVSYDEGFEFVMQISSDEKANFNIVDSGNFYFGYNPTTKEWSVRCDFY